MKYVFSDFDGTLTDGDQLSPIFFKIIHLLKNYNIPLIIVTGRSKSWAHFLLTHFNYLDEVISEGGAVLTTRNEIDFEDIILLPTVEVEKLVKITLKLLQSFPKLRLTTDSYGRHCDRAIDLKLIEDLSIMLELENFLKKNGVSYSCSSVHLNFWCGNISKSKAVLNFIKNNNIVESDCLYFGDAKNDESMFKDFSNTVGVSNIKTILNQLTYLPKIILEGQDKRGPYGVYHYLKNHLAK